MSLGEWIDLAASRSGTRENLGFALASSGNSGIQVGLLPDRHRSFFDTGNAIFSPFTISEFVGRQLRHTGHPLYGRRIVQIRQLYTGRRTKPGVLHFIGSFARRGRVQHRKDNTPVLVGALRSTLKRLQEEEELPPDDPALRGITSHILRTIARRVRELEDECEAA